MFLSSQTVTHDQDTNCSPPFSRKTIRNCLLGLNTTTRVNPEVSRLSLRHSDLRLRKNLCTSAIIIVQAAQDRKGDDLATFMIGWHRPSFLLRNLLLDALMRPGSVEVMHIRVEHAVELPLMQDEQMIEAFTSYTAEETFTDSICTWGVIRSFENLNITHLCNPREAQPKLTINIPNEVLWPIAIGSGLP